MPIKNVTVFLSYKKFALWFTLVFSSVLCSDHSFAQDPFLLNSPEAIPTSKPEPTAKFSGYAVYRNDFQRLCLNLGIDGYYDVWNAVIEKVQVRYDSCKNCRQLYKVLYCKKVKSSKAPSNKVNMPSTELLASASELFRKIAEDKQVALQTVQSLAPVWEELLGKQESQSEKYFSILIEYMKAPLTGYLEEGLAAQTIEKKAEKKKVLENLF